MFFRSKAFLITAIVLLVGGIAWLLFSLFSHSSDAHLKLIPKNAAAVLKIDIKNLAVKADPMKLMQNPVFKNVPATGKSSIRNLIADPFSTGIDPLENVYGFLAKEDKATISAIVFKVTDEEELEKFERGLGIGGNLVVEDGIYYSEIDENRCIAWNSEAGIIMAVHGGDKKIFAKKYLEQDKKESILANDNYKTFAEKSFDLGLFLDNKSLSQMSGTTSSLSSLGFTDGHGELLLNFENDKVSTIYTNYPETKTTASILKKTGPDAKQFNAIAPQPPLLYLGLSADINALFDALGTDPSMKQNIDAMSMYLGMPNAELRKLFTGDISLAFTDYKDISSYDPRVGANVDMLIKQMGGSQEDRSEYALNVPIAYINVGVTDDEKVNKMLTELGMQQMGNFYAMPGINFIVYAIAKDGHLLVTNDYYAAETLAKDGKFPGQLPAAISKTNPFSLWADLDQKHFPIALTESMKDEYNEQTVDLFLQIIKPFQSVKMESKADGSQLDISIEAGEGNSLYRLITYYGSLAN
ncbi:MAG: DUF4836 family protein [Bacteroidota bacterium]|nr:DUF4836 family protein [Bacteroidota bacterium]